MVALLTWTFQSDVEEELDDDLDHENEIDKAREQNRKKYNYKKGS